MQYILTEEEYKAFKENGESSTDKAYDDALQALKQSEEMTLSAHRSRSLYRAKSLALYEIDPQEYFTRIGSLTITNEQISSYSDDEWDEFIQAVDAEFTELNEPVITDRDTEELIDVLPKNENQVLMIFSEDKPFVERNVSKSVIRFYPKVYEKQALDIDWNKHKVVGKQGEAQDLHFIIYTLKG